MEKLIFQSPKKQRIMAVQKILRENNIPVSSIKIYIYVEWSHSNVEDGGMVKESLEKRDELTIPIEYFNEKLNDSQTFEIYTDEKFGWNIA